MVLLSVGCISEDCDIYTGFNELSTCLKSTGVSIGLVESDSGNYHFIKCLVGEGENNNLYFDELKQSYYVYAANIIYQLIIDNFQTDVIKKVIRNNYSFFRYDEAKIIEQRCTNILTGRDNSSNENYLFNTRRKNKIVQKILEYISDNSEIIIEGFIRFRLKDFTNEIEEVVDKTVEEYLVEREYGEFIKLLKYFVEIQDSQIEIINIVINQYGNYMMYNNNGEEITRELIKSFAGDASEGIMDYDDMLVSLLITAAPKYIVIHNSTNIKNKEVLNTIKNVFEDRLKICTGCEMCVKQEDPVREF